MIFNERIIKALDSSTSLHSVPFTIADDMVNMLDSTDFFKEPDLTITASEYINSHRVIDVSCKSGSLLFSFYKKFMIALRNVFPDRDDRDYFIVRNLLFGLCPSARYLSMLRATFYSNKKYDLSNELGNFYHYDFKDQIGVDSKEVKELLSKMKFDVVCGNPPYNNDMYLDFVMLGHRLAKSYDLWITPAKFIGMQNSNNTTFLSLFKETAIVAKYFTKATEIFNVQLDGGIVYYLMGKSNHSSIIINNISINSTELVSFNISLLKILHKINLVDSTSYNDTIFNICKSYFCSKQPTEVSQSTGSGYYLINDRNRVEIDRTDLKHLDSFDNYKVFSVKVNDIPLVHILSPNEVYGRAAVLLGYGDLSYCESLKSFFETKTIWYLVYFSGCGNINTSTFRFVPNPGSFDKIYEDKPLEGYMPDENGIYTDINGVVHCSLYARYKLTDEEINVIESVIRERK